MSGMAYIFAVPHSERRPLFMELIFRYRTVFQMPQNGNFDHANLVEILPMLRNVDSLDESTNLTVAILVMQLLAARLDAESMGFEISERLVPATLRQLQASKEKEPVIRLLKTTAYASFDSYQPFIQGSISSILPFLEDPCEDIHLASFYAISALLRSAAKSHVRRAAFLPFLRKLVSQSVKAFHLTAEFRSAITCLLRHLTASCTGYLGFQLDNLISLLLVGFRAESFLRKSFFSVILTCRLGKRDEAICSLEALESFIAGHPLFFKFHLHRVTSEVIELLYNDDIHIRRNAWWVFVSIASFVQESERVSVS